jgi:hypothetical protein
MTFHEVNPNHKITDRRTHYERKDHRAKIIPDGKKARRHLSEVRVSWI